MKAKSIYNELNVMIYAVYHALQTTLLPSPIHAIVKDLILTNNANELTTK